MDWQPTADLPQLRARSELLRTLRHFFEKRGVLEVQTPVLGRFGVSEPAIDSVSAGWAGYSGYLQSSPEYHMKRLLAAGSGPIFQISPVFRAGEQGRCHNPEFTMLEWYRPGFTLDQLMEEVAELLVTVLDCPRPQTHSYRSLFRQLLSLDPWHDTEAGLCEAAADVSGLPAVELDRDEALDVLMTHCIEPQLAGWGPVFITDYPPSQAALAQTLEKEGVTVARRFELYVNGLELCNGYHELTDAREQAERFRLDNAERQHKGKSAMAADERLLAALAAGVPECCGVALGLDRLLMLAAGASHIEQVLAFPVSRA